MSDKLNYQVEIKNAINDFITVANLAGDAISLDEITIEFLNAPHKPPSKIPVGKMAIYAFWWKGTWLKVGKVGAKSHARYISQHYTGSAQSTLAGSIIKDPKMKVITNFTLKELSAWIKESTCRVNILMPSTRNKGLLSLLESFLHVRLQPRYEG